MRKLIVASSIFLTSFCNLQAHPEQISYCEDFDLEKFLIDEIERSKVVMEECLNGIESGLDIQQYYYLLGQKTEAEYILKKVRDHHE